MPEKLFNLKLWYKEKYPVVNRYYCRKLWGCFLNITFAQNFILLHNTSEFFTQCNSKFTETNKLSHVSLNSYLQSMLQSDLAHHYWGPPRGFGDQGNRDIYFRGTREQMGEKKWGEKGNKGNLGETGCMGKQDVEFEKQSNLFQGNKGADTLWEGFAILFLLTLSHIMRKRVFGVCDQVRLKQAWLAWNCDYRN